MPFLKHSGSISYWKNIFTMQEDTFLFHHCQLGYIFKKIKFIFKFLTSTGFFILLLLILWFR